MTHQEADKVPSSEWMHIIPHFVGIYSFAIVASLWVRWAGHQQLVLLQFIVYFFVFSFFHFSCSTGGADMPCSKECKVLLCSSSPFFRTTPFLLIPRGHMPRTLKRTSASSPHRRFKIFAPGVPGPHTEDINQISWTQHFAGASPSTTLKLNSYSRKLFHMAPITRLGKTS